MANAGFGVTAGISKNTNNSVQVASKLGVEGEIIEEYTHGGVEEIEEEIYSNDLTNAALNGQTGTTAAGVVTNHNLIEVNNDYKRATKRTRKALAAGA